MKSFFTVFLFCLSAAATFGQDSLLRSNNEYLIVLINKRILSNSVTVEVDNGSRIESLRDENGRTLVLPTTAAALNYLSDRGWGLFLMKKMDALAADKIHYVLRRKKS